jgi:hypothetical protein
MPKPFLVEHVEVLCLLFLLVGGGLLGVSVVSLTGSSIELGGWAWYTAIIGAILLLIGVLWLIKIGLTVRKLNRHLREESKAVFQKSLDDAEYLAWTLPSRYEAKLVEKKREFGLR